MRLVADKLETSVYRSVGEETDAGAGTAGTGGSESADVIAVDDSEILALSKLCPPDDDSTDVLVPRNESTRDICKLLDRSLDVDSLELETVVHVPRNASLLTRFLYDMEHCN